MHWSPRLSPLGVHCRRSTAFVRLLILAAGGPYTSTIKSAAILATIMLSNTRHLAGNRFLATTNAGAQTPTKHLVLRVFAD